MHLVEAKEIADDIIQLDVYHDHRDIVDHFFLRCEYPKDKDGFIKIMQSTIHNILTLSTKEKKYDKSNMGS